jgi:hypothetical protein
MMLIKLPNIILFGEEDNTEVEAQQYTHMLLVVVN